MPKNTTNISVKLVFTPDEHATVAQAAAQNHLPLATWLRVLGLNQAQRDAMEQARRDVTHASDR